jgi:hypothetical protein
MKRLGELAAAITSVLLLAGCAAVSQQKAEPPRPDDLLFHNLQVLPQNITRDELLTTMRGFRQALGVKCSYCHAPKPDDPNELEYRSDAKQEKRSARTMLRMLNTINNQYVARVEDVYTRASCWTCHRGKTQPEIAPSLPPPEPK